MSFKIGDTVILKSGGPSMTVQNIITDETSGPLKILFQQLKMSGFEDGAIMCKWFDKPSNSFKTDYFKPNMLKNLNEV